MSRQERIKRVAKEASSLKTQFVSVLTHTQIFLSKKEIESCEFLTELRITLVNLPLSDEFKHYSFLRKKRRSIEEAENVSRIFKVLKHYWNYTDFSLLQHIIHEFGNDTVKGEIHLYASQLEDYEKRTTVKDFEDAVQDKKYFPYDFSEAVFVVDKDPAVCTLYEIRQIVESQAHQSSLKPYTFLVKKARGNSVLITLAFPRDAIELLVPGLDEQFLSTHNIVSVTIDEKPLQIYSKEYLMV